MMTIKSLNKMARVLEIITVMFNCTVAEAFKLIKDTETIRAIQLGDSATLYQSAPCCVEAIGAELRNFGNPVGNGFTDERINVAICCIRDTNLKNKARKIAV